MERMARFLILALGVSIYPLLGQICRVEFDSPVDGANVGYRSMVEGVAETPKGRDLWVFVSMRGVRGWWPQGGGPAEIDGREWAVLSHYGQSHDIGHDFDLTAVVVDDTTSKNLKEWVERGDRTGRYLPISLPEPLQGCPVPRVRVKKTSH